jgi:hypothetical protein
MRTVEILGGPRDGAVYAVPEFAVNFNVAVLSPVSWSVDLDAGVVPEIAVYPIRSRFGKQFAVYPGYPGRLPWDEI